MSFSNLKILLRISIATYLFLLFYLLTVPLKPQTTAQTTLDQTTTVEPATVSQPTPTISPITKTINLSQHNTKADCWFTINGRYYNITPFFGSHPGGDSLLLKYCGKDATVAYNNKEFSPPVGHSANADQLLSIYLVK